MLTSNRQFKLITLIKTCLCFAILAMTINVCEARVFIGVGGFGPTYYTAPYYGGGYYPGYYDDDDYGYYGGYSPGISFGFGGWGGGGGHWHGGGGHWHHH